MDVWSHGTCKVYRIHRTELPLVGALQAGTTLIFPSPQTYLFLIEGNLLHNIVLASAIHSYESATGIPVSLPSLTFLPPPTPSCPSRSLRNPGLSSLSYTVNSHWLPILLVVVYTLPCNSLHPSHHLLPSPPVSTTVTSTGPLLPQCLPQAGGCTRSQGRGTPQRSLLSSSQLPPQGVLHLPHLTGGKTKALSHEVASHSPQPASGEVAFVFM